MTTSSAGGALPPALADVVSPELPSIAEEIVRTIAEEVPEYVRPLAGAFGRGVRTGVTNALERFMALVRDPEQPDPELSRTYVALGREELRAGRTLDSLQAAYRVGARVAWRRIAELSISAGFDPQTLAALAEAMFAYIDELSAESVEGYARAQSELAGEHARRRRALVDALLRPATPPLELAALADQAQWTLPRSAAALACAPDDAARLARRLGADVVHATVAGHGCAIVPDAEAPGRRDSIRVAAGERLVAIGPDGPIDRLRTSWRLARATLLLRAGSSGASSADDHLADLILFEATHVVDRVAERRLAGLDSMTRAARERTVRTALAYLQHRGSAPAMARALHVHPQTARYRMNRIREVLGEQLDETGAQFELEAALRRVLTELEGARTAISEPAEA